MTDNKEGMSAKKPLRIGILVDSLELHAWAAGVVRDVLKDPCTELSLVVIHDTDEEERLRPQQKKGIRGVFRKIFRRRDLSKALWFFYKILDAKLVKRANDPFENVDLSEELKGVHQIRVVPQTDRFFHRFEEKDLKIIRDADLDVMIRFGFNIIKGPILTSARYGVWSFHHGDNQQIRGVPPYFWELHNKAEVNGIILQILAEKLDSGRVLYRSYGRTVPGISVKKNSIGAYWKSSSFVIRRLRQLHEYGFDWMQKELPTFKEDPKIQGKLYRSPTNAQVLRFFFSGFWFKFVQQLRKIGKIEQWFVMYRDLKGGQRIRLASPKGHYYADPFVIRGDGKDYIFFEDYLYAEDRGIISYVEVRPDLTASEAKVALDLPYHLSYPFVFEHDGAMYMIPETGANSSVELYKAIEFPGRWELCKVLNKGLRAFDVTLLVRDGVYWFFCNMVERGNESQDELFLFYADSLTGEWKYHPKNPIVSDVRRARPAGKIFERDGKLIRPGQDGSRNYGGAYWLNEITALSKTDYQERPYQHMQPDFAPNLTGMHTYNFNERLEVIDVKAFEPKNEVL